MFGSGWIPRIGGCGPMWSGGRSPGTWRRPHPCSLWRAVVSLRSWRDAKITIYPPADAVATCEDAGRAWGPVVGRPENALGEALLRRPRTFTTVSSGSPGNGHSGLVAGASGGIDGGRSTTGPWTRIHEGAAALGSRRAADRAHAE